MHAFAWWLALFSSVVAVDLAAANVVVITEFYSDDKECQGAPSRVEVDNADVQAMMTFGSDVNTCQTLPGLLWGRTRGPGFGSSLRFNISFEEYGPSCFVRYFEDHKCEKPAETGLRGIFEGDCRPWHYRTGKKRGIMSLRADEPGPFTPGSGGSARSWCTDEPVPAGAYDKTCISAEELRSMPKMDGHGAQGLCFASCLGPGGAISSATSRETFDALFASDACAASCNSTGKTQVHHLLVIEEKLDCNFVSVEP